VRVDVAYARPDVQCVVPVEIEPGATAVDAIRASGILERFPEIDLAVNGIGVFGKPCGPERVLKPGERVEIYRPLLADPREARRHRAVGK
jgi:putative ubiquitin-RnfH superfamily antitoxin RatB of RatAB toxin-antitoxin module